MTMVEERRAERIRSFLRARIMFNNGNSTIDCTIKNISATGAKIEVSSTISLPEEFDLDVPQKGKVYRARLRWRTPEAVGVEFQDRDTTIGAQPVTAMEKLEVENRRLKAKVAALTKRLQDLGQDVE